METYLSIYSFILTYSLCFHTYILMTFNRVVLLLGCMSVRTCEWQCFGELHIISDYCHEIVFLLTKLDGRKDKVDNTFNILCYIVVVE